MPRPARESVTVVGINRTQDASVCVARGAADVTLLQKERITRRKHHWGRVGDLGAYVERIAALREPIDLVVECFSSDDEAERIDEYRQELIDTLAFRGEPWIVSMSHHLAHVYSALFPSPFDDAAVMVIDAQGSRVKDLTEPYRQSDAVAPQLLEIASFYAGGPDGIECLGKQLWDGDWKQPVGLGCFYYLLTRLVFPGEGNEGKMMGLAPFGRSDALGLPPLHVDENRVSIPEAWLEVLEERGEFTYFRDGRGSFDECADLAAAGQRAFEEALLEVANWLRGATGAERLCFAGGTALNCSANGRLLREGPFREVFIPPSPHDGGTALGCALYGLRACLDVEPEFRWENDFLGPEPDSDAIDEAARHALPGLAVERPDDLIECMVEMLRRGCVVALYNGRSESGPRALGNRSIIADARRAGMQDFINAHVKGREWFRPLAPLVLSDSAATIFEVDRPAPFMQYAATVRREHRAALPAITHVDGTARLQTVDARNTPFLHALMRRFADRTGCPVLLNTSLNGRGDPLVETPADALACLATTSMHALAMPPYLITKRVEPPIPS